MSGLENYSWNEWCLYGSVGLVALFTLAYAVIRLVERVKRGASAPKAVAG